MTWPADRHLSKPLFLFLLVSGPLIVHLLEIPPLSAVLSRHYLPMTEKTLKILENLLLATVAKAVIYPIVIILREREIEVENGIVIMEGIEIGIEIEIGTDIETRGMIMIGGPGKPAEGTTIENQVLVEAEAEAGAGAGVGAEVEVCTWIINLVQTVKNQKIEHLHLAT